MRAALGAALALGLLVSPASAELDTVGDPAGDIPDILRFTIDNRENAVVTRMKYADIEKVEFESFYIKWGSRTYYRVRYFEVPAGQHTAREQHPHDHGVVIQHGRARVTLGDEQHELGPGDVVYVGPDELHCFEALGDETLGFICVAPPRP